jgi:hypothetical protein
VATFYEKTWNFETISRSRDDDVIDLEDGDNDNFFFFSRIETSYNTNTITNYKICTIDCSKFFKT